MYFLLFLFQNGDEDEISSFDEDISSQKGKKFVLKSPLSQKCPD